MEYVNGVSRNGMARKKTIIQLIGTRSSTALLDPGYRQNTTIYNTHVIISPLLECGKTVCTVFLFLFPQGLMNNQMSVRIFFVLKKQTLQVTLLLVSERFLAEFPSTKISQNIFGKNVVILRNKLLIS
jgi:hypothetical protein